MSIYFLLHDAAFFHQLLCPPLAASWRGRTFEPCRALASDLMPSVLSFSERFHTRPDETLVAMLHDGLPFDRTLWRMLVGEVLLYAAREVPEIETAPDTLCHLLTPNHQLPNNVSRESFAPIQQVHFGTKDLVLGGCYFRPEHSGWNDRKDVARLTDYLESINPHLWTVADLAALGEMDEEERAEELDLVKDWFPALCDLYRRANEHQQVIVCETIFS
jgi:hypothetical protein